MALTPEWRRRFENWIRELPRHFYRPLGDLVLAGFTTREHLTPAQALKGPFKRMKTGTKWGAKWEYAWFKGRVTLPKAAAGQRIVLKADTGGESLLFLDGVAAGAIDWAHPEVLLSPRARPGERFEFLIESYAGHGPTPCSAGPVPPGRLTVPEPPRKQCALKTSTFGVWDEDAYQLWVDAQTLFTLRESLEPDALRVAELDAGLRDFTLLVDFEADLEERRASFRAARERLKPLLACRNGSTAPVFFAFGHAHIDTAWLWPLAETRRKCARTFSTQLALMAEYPEFRFLASQPHQYRMVKTHYPELYKRLKAAVAAGRFIAEGGMWVEADTNLTGGESLIRQFLHGKRFLRQEFGVDNELLWLPDVFGYSGALPQIMRGCGIKYFSTAKIFWNYNGGETFPYNTFRWQGLDGSEVLAHFCNDYNAGCEPNQTVGRWKERVQKDGLATRLYPFGFGDGGGGATRNHLEFLRRQKDLEGAPRLRVASPVEFFKDQERRGIPDARYVGELYFQAHRGTYTSQARVKRGNRKCELALREAEAWGAVAAALKGFRFPATALNEAWRHVLLCQFHDIIPGSSIQRVYEEAGEMHGVIAGVARETARQATMALTDASRNLTVFNSLSWERTALVPLPPQARQAVDESGRALPSQNIGETTCVEVAVPPCGWTTLRVPAESGEAPAAEAVPALSASPRHLENELLRLTFNAKGEITSCFDKEARVELAAGVCNSFKMYKDVPGAWDAWDLDSTYASAPVELPRDARLEVLAAGPLVAILKLTRRLNRSLLIQEIRLRRGSRCVEFHTVVDWRESHKLLKVAFPVNVHADEAVHEIQFGHLRRPNHCSRPYDADRFEVSAHKWTALCEENRGCAVLNDCKYGVNVLGKSIVLSLLKSPLAPDMTADKGRQEFSYAFYSWNGSFAESDVVRAAYELNVPALTAPGAAGTRSAFALDAANVIVETIKPAEDGSGDVVVRLYESKRTATRCELRTTLPVRSARATDMLEEGGKPLPCRDGRLELRFRPFEIKTLRLKLRK
jgi:alpha-mannosidase